MPEFYDDTVLKKLHEAELEILRDFCRVCEKNRLVYFAIAGTLLGAVRHKGFIPWDDDIDIAMPRRDYEKLIRIMEKEYGEKYYVMNVDHDSAYPLFTTRICRKGTVFREASFRTVNCRIGIFLDLYPYDNLADQPLLYKFQIWSAWVFSKLLILRSIEKPYIAQTGLSAKLILIVCGIAYRVLRVLRIDPEKLFRRGEAISRRYEHVKTERIGFPFDTDPEWNTVYRKDIFPRQFLEFEGLKIRAPRNVDPPLQSLYGSDYMTLPPVEKRKTHYPDELRFLEEISETEAAEDRRKE